MKRTSILTTLGVATLAIACGGGPSVAKYGTAINKPTGTVSKASTSTAVEEQSAGAGVGSSFGGIAIPTSIRRGGSSLSEMNAFSAALGTIGHTDGVNLMSTISDIVRDGQDDDGDHGTFDKENPASYYCGANAPGKQIVDAYKKASGSSGSGGGCSGAVSFDLTCKNADTVVEIKWHLAIDCSGNAQLKDSTPKIDLTMVAKFGKHDGGVGALFAIEGTFSGTVEGKKMEIKLSGGAGYYRKGEDYVGAAVIIANEKSYVFYSFSDSQGVSTGSLNSDQALCIKGANGIFIIKCKDGEDGKATCSLWNKDGTAAEGTTGDAPTGGECAENALLKALGDFAAL